MLVLEPKKLNERMLKIHQQNKKLLMENEVLIFDEYLDIDEKWNFELDPKLIKCKKIICNVYLDLNHIPSWIKNIEIHGSFDCMSCELTTLKNCPKIIHNNFDCEYNKLESLDDGPTFVGRKYWCQFNRVVFTQEYVTSICKVNGYIFV